MALDPVCGRDISPKQSQWLIAYKGDIYHFCSGDCRHRFGDDPNEYLTLEESAERMPATQVAAVAPVPAPSKETFDVRGEQSRYADRTPARRR
jgi:YHS domain-containing protein